MSLERLVESAKALAAEHARWRAAVERQNTALDALPSEERYRHPSGVDAMRDAGQAWAEYSRVHDAHIKLIVEMYGLEALL